MSQPTKEWKYVQCFISDRAAACNHCRTRTWKKGYKVYGFKKPNGKWAFCTDRQCYLDQGGELTIFKRDKPESIEPPKRQPAPIYMCTHCNHEQGDSAMLRVGNAHYHRTCVDTIAFQATFTDNWHEANKE